MWPQAGCMPSLNPTFSTCETVLRTVKLLLMKSPRESILGVGDTRPRVLSCLWFKTGAVPQVTSLLFSGVHPHSRHTHISTYTPHLQIFPHGHFYILHTYHNILATHIYTLCTSLTHIHNSTITHINLTYITHHTTDKLPTYIYYTYTICIHTTHIS